MAISGIASMRIVQIGMVVKNAEQSAEQYRRVLGFDIPQVARLTEAVEQTQATYHGQPMEGRAKIIAFDIGDIQLEFIQPVGESTVWHDFLNQHGEGLHHFALPISDTTAAVEAFKQKGYEVIQQGYFGDRATGGQYTYLDTDKDLGVVIELLQVFGERGERTSTEHPAGKGLGTNRITQLGILVHDIQASIERYVDVLGLPQAPIIETPGYARSKTTYLGENSEATAKLAFFNLGQVQIELIEPDAHPSVWREYLETRGEGVQHIAFQVANTEQAMKHLGGHGIGILQQGLYADASGMYTYVDSQQQQAICIELLQNF